MAGSTFGTLFTITTWGESHGPAIGVTVDGCPAGLPLSEEDIQCFLDRRKPGQSRYTTARRERDYGNLKDCYRPGHADYTFDAKYGIRDYRGGGRSSGRETIGRVAAGAIASKLLAHLGIHLTVYTKSIGPILVPESAYDYSCISSNSLYMPNNEYAKKASAYLEECLKSHDSSGGIIECIIDGMPVGIGEPVFQKLDACLAKAILSIGAIKGVEIGDGFQVAQSKGSENNDAFCMEQEKITKKTNHSGGILGGLSDGSSIILRAAVKPTSSISQEQDTVSIHGTDTKITVTGRHDPVIVPRAVVVVESMAAITIADLLMAGMSARLENLEKIYKF